MIQVRDIFGSVVETSKPIKRTRSSAIPKPVESRTTVPLKPVQFGSSDPMISKLIQLSKNPMFTDLKKDEEMICQRISEIRKNKDGILKKVESHLMSHSNYGVIQAINFIERGTLWQ